MGLFTPVWKQNNKQKALQYVADCNKQDKLELIAKEAVSLDVRAAAISKITDQALLLQYALGKSENARNAAIPALKDEVLIYRVAKEGQNKEVRELAADRLTDQGYIADIARSDPDSNIRLKMVKRMTDPKLIYEIGIKDEDPYIRQEAVRALDDQEEIIKIAKGDDSHLVRFAARKKIEDEKIKALLTLEDDMAGAYERTDALKIVDPGDDVLADMAIRSNSITFKEALLKKIRSKAAIVRIVQGSSSDMTVSMALKYLDAAEELAPLLKEEKLAKQAFGRMYELDLLDDESIELIPESMPEKIELAKDKNRFYEAVKTAPQGETVLKAYKEQDYKTLITIPTPESVEAALLLIREAGEDKQGGPSGLAMGLFYGLRDIWRKHESLRPLLDRAGKYPVKSHYDSGSGSCHIDRGPLTFDFSR